MKTNVLITLLILGVALMLGCGFMENMKPETAQGIIVEQSIDTFGYTLGLFAAKDPVFKSQVEKYYNEVKEKGLTVAIVNEIMRKFRDQDIAYQVLAYKMTSLIRVLGGQIDQNGMIESFGTITDHYMEIGKNAYLEAIKNTQED